MVIVFITVVIAKMYNKTSDTTNGIPFGFSNVAIRDCPPLKKDGITCFSRCPKTKQNKMFPFRGQSPLVAIIIKRNGGSQVI